MGRRQRARTRAFRHSVAIQIQDQIESLEEAQERVDVLEAALVRFVRQNLGSWADVGQCFGISAQAAHKRFRGLGV